MHKISAVIFDMDGLMLDTEKIYYRVNHQTASELGFDGFTVDFYKQFIGSGDEGYRAGIYEAFGDDNLAERFLDEADRRLEQVFLKEPIDKKPGVIELLDYLRQEEIPAVVASSTNRRMVDAILDHTGIVDYFSGIVGGDEVAQAKPAPDIFLKAADMLNCPKEEMLVLEDSLNGIRAADKAGIHVVMVPDIIEPNDEAREKALAIYSDLFEVRDVIAQLER